jgi:hypothetical protein
MMEGMGDSGWKSGRRLAQARRVCQVETRLGPAGLTPAETGHEMGEPRTRDTLQSFNGDPGMCHIPFAEVLFDSAAIDSGGR